MLAVPGVNLAVHTDRPILSTGAYLDFKRHVDYLLQQGHRGQARLLWLLVACPFRATARACGRQWGDTAPCIDAPCARCDGSLGGFKFPFIGTWCRRAVLVQEGATASEAWAAYHGCYEGIACQRLWCSGLRAQDIILMYVSAVAWPGGIWRPPLGQSHSGEASPWVAGRWEVMWHPPMRSLPPSVAAKALRWGVLLLAMAFRGDAAPGRYATEAMERSGSDPALMTRVQETNVRAFRQKNGLMQDADFSFAFEAFEDAVRVAISSPLNGRGCVRSRDLTFSQQQRQWWRRIPGG